MSVSVLGKIAKLINGVHVRECALDLVKMPSESVRLIQNLISAMGAVVTLDGDIIKLVPHFQSNGSVRVPEQFADKITARFGLYNTRSNTTYKMYDAGNDQHLVRLPFWWPAEREFPIILHTGVVRTEQLMNPQHWCSRRFCEVIVPVFAQQGDSCAFKFVRVRHEAYLEILKKSASFKISRSGVEEGEDFSVPSTQYEIAEFSYRGLYELVASDFPGLGDSCALALGRLLNANTRFDENSQALLAKANTRKAV